MAKHVFISYSRTDRPYVGRLAAHLTAVGVLVWYDYDVEAGDTFAGKIEEAIDNSFAVIVVVSPDSTASRWVRREIARATRLGIAILPLILRPTTEIPVEIEGLQHETVTGGEMPTRKFVANLVHHPRRAGLGPISMLGDHDLTTQNDDIDGELWRPIEQALRTPMDELGVLGLAEEQQSGYVRVPSVVVRRHLFPTEKFRGEWRRHWVDPIFAIVVLALATFLAVQWAAVFPVEIHVQSVRLPSSQIATPCLSVIGVLAALRALSWPSWRLTLTNKQVMVVGGLLWRRTATMPLERLSNVSLSQTPPGRILNYGTLSFVGQRRTWRIRHVPHPDDVRLQVLEETFEPEASAARSRPARIDDGL